MRHEYADFMSGLRKKGCCLFTISRNAATKKRRIFSCKKPVSQK